MTVRVSRRPTVTTHVVRTGARIGDRVGDPAVIDTYRVRATVPAKLTRPPIGATTGSPTAGAKSMLRRPAQYSHTGGSNTDTTGVDTGATRHGSVSAGKPDDTPAGPASATTTARVVPNVPDDPNTPESGTPQESPAAANRERNMITAFEWICDTRLSVTPSTSPISARVMPSS